MATRTFMSHIVDVTTLKEGDHIYRHTNVWTGCSKFADLHHGIVYSLPQIEGKRDKLEQYLNEGVVFEITKEDGLVKSSLKKFKQNYNIRKAYYSATKNELTLHRSQTCYQESRLTKDEIITNIDKLFEYFENDEANKKHLFNKAQSIIVCCMTGKINEKNENCKAFVNILTKRQGNKQVKFESSIKNKDYLFKLKIGDHICHTQKGAFIW